MKHFFFFTIASILLAMISNGQAVVVDAAKVKEMPGYHYLPDVEGKVLIQQSLLEPGQFSFTQDTVTVFPFWPVAKSGANERGGIYANLDNDPELELVYSIGNFTYAFNLNSTSVSGWPKLLDYPADGAPASGDIDGDGFGEIVVTTHQTATFANGKIYAFEINGANVQGFPISMLGGPVRTPVLADLDDDGADEIIVAVRKWPEGFIHVYHGDGTLFLNFPVRMDYAPGSAVAVGDINGDEIPEIIAESYYSLHAFNLEGVILPGFPYSPGENRVFSYSTPVLADLNGDGQREIICGDHSTSTGNGAVHIVRSDGTSYPGWPKFTDYWIYGPPSVGDINGDGILDIAVGDQVLSPTPSDKVYAWTTTTGSPLPGFPISNLSGINSQIILADLDEDDHVELVFDDNTAINTFGQYPGYNHDGTPMEHWPLKTLGTTFFINPMALDINFDGIIDISGGGTEKDFGNTSIYLWNTHSNFNKDLAILPVLQYNTRHTGVYGDNLQVGIPEDRSVRHPEWKIYPNPCYDKLTIDSRQLTGINLSKEQSEPESPGMVISDLLGREIMQIGEISSWPLEINISSLQPGLYFIRITGDHGSMAPVKFLKVAD